MKSREHVDVQKVSSHAGRQREEPDCTAPEPKGVSSPVFDVGRSVGSAAATRKHAGMVNRVSARAPNQARTALLQLQKRYGNRHVQRVLAVARQSEETEEEEVQLQRQNEEEEQGKELQAQRQGPGEPTVAPEVEGAITRKRGGGQALDTGAQEHIGSALGADFGGVRVHTDTEADTLNRSLNARAFTTGQDIFFRQGEYNPGTTGGQELLAHELTHVVQQGGGGMQRQSSHAQRLCDECGDDLKTEENRRQALQTKMTVGAPDDPAEEEADRTAGALMRRILRQDAAHDQMPNIGQVDGHAWSGTVLHRQGDWWPSNVGDSAPDMQERNWRQAVQARSAPEDPPAYSVRVRSHMPPAPRQQQRSTPEHCHPGHHRRPEPRFDFSQLEEFDRQQAWNAWMATVGQLGRTWESMRPHVRQFNLSRSQNREVLDEVYDIRVPDSGTMSTAALQQPAGSAGEGGRRPESGIRVAEVFDQGGAANLGRGGEQGLRRASGPVTTKRRAAEAADDRVSAAVHLVQEKARAITTGQIGIEQALNRINTTRAEQEEAEARNNLRAIEGARDDAKVVIDSLKSLVIGVSKLKGDNPIEGAAEIAGVIGQAIVDAAYSGRLEAAKRHVDSAVRRVNRLVEQGDQLALNRAQSELDEAYEAFKSARAGLRAALTERREAYDQLAWAAGRQSRGSLDTKRRIRAAIAAIPIVEIMVSTLGNGLESMTIPQYTRQSGIGYGIAGYHRLPHVAQFEAHLGQLYSYITQFMFEKADWDTRLTSLRSVMRTLRGNTGPR